MISIEPNVQNVTISTGENPKNKTLAVTLIVSAHTPLSEKEAESEEKVKNLLTNQLTNPLKNLFQQPKCHAPQSQDTQLLQDGETTSTMLPPVFSAFNLIVSPES